MYTISNIRPSKGVVIAIPMVVLDRHGGDKKLQGTCLVDPGASGSVAVHRVGLYGTTAKRYTNR